MTIKVEDEIASVSCCACGTVFGMQRTLRDRRIEDHKTFHCPNGHQQVFLAPKPLAVDPDVERIATLTKDLAAATKRAETLTAWVKRAPHLATCNVRVDRPCDCGRVECVGDVAAPEVTSAN